MGSLQIGCGTPSHLEGAVMIELLIEIQRSEVSKTKAHIRIGATLLTALIYLGTLLWH